MAGFDEDGFGGFEVLMMTPVGLHEDGVDLGKVDGFGLVADGFYEGADAEVFDGAEDAFGGTHNEVEGRFGEGVVRQADAVELGEDVVLELVVVEGL